MTRRRRSGRPRRSAGAHKTDGSDQTINIRLAAVAALVIALVMTGVRLQTDAPWSVPNPVDLAAGSADGTVGTASGPAGAVSGLYGLDMQSGRSGATTDNTGGTGGSSSIAEAFAQLAGPVEDDGCVKAEITLAGDVPGTAADLLRAYRVRRDCLPVQCGYIDLYGEAWGCVIQGDDWVDVCVVRGEQDGRKSVLTVVRMDVAAWEREVGSADVDEYLSVEGVPGEGESG